MKGIWKLAWATLRHEKKQTLALFFGILLGAALFSGVGSLFSSGLEAAKENARVEYGDWLRLRRDGADTGADEAGDFNEARRAARWIYDNWKLS